MHRSHALVAALAGACALAVAACGSPAGPSGAVVLRGTVVGDGGVASASSAGSSSRAAAGRITVTVAEDGSLTTTVAGNGTFELTGLPEGGFTLVFSRDGVTLGTITIGGFEPGAEITITVQVTGNSVILVRIENADGDDDGEDDEVQACLIHGGKVGRNVELEGKVSGAPGTTFKLRVNGNRASGLVDVNAGGASWKCNGKQTGTCSASSLEDGSKVHVSGTLATCDMSAAQVDASKVMIQK